MISSKQTILNRLDGLRSTEGKAKPPNITTIQKGNIERFTEITAENACEIAFIENDEAALNYVANFLLENNLSNQAMASPELQSRFSKNQLDLTFGTSQGNDTAAISQATAAIEDTGTLVLSSSKSSPTLLNFLSDYHFVLLSKELIFRTKTDFWSWHAANKLPMPRAINFISGPSRTADIEQTIQLGAHGPRQLHILLMD